MTEEYQKALCMSELAVRHSTFAGAHFYDLDSGKVNSSFIFVVQGGAKLFSLRKTLSVQAGELFYIPDGLPYSLQWTGAPDIEYYSLHALSKRYDSAMQTNENALQKIPALSTEGTLALFRKIFSLMASGGRAEKIRAVSLYYSFYADALPLLETERPPELNPALRKALDVLQQTYRENKSVEEIAAACYISASRLFHLFQTRLDTTPVAYRNELRVRRAAELLRTNASLEEICAETGFSSVTYFREIFKSRTGMTPSEYRRKIYNQS